MDEDDRLASSMTSVYSGYIATLNQMRSYRSLLAAEAGPPNLDGALSPEGPIFIGTGAYLLA